MTTITDLKIYAINIITLAVNFANVDLALKILLTIVAIGYTGNKWYYMIQERKNK
jgi:hypothetical protein